MRTLCSIVTIAILSASAQQGSVFRISPDGAYALFGSEQESRLWLENRRTHERRMVLEVTVQTMSLLWSPDSAAFVVNDRWASDRERAWIYDVTTLERLDLGSRIQATDPNAALFLPNDKTAPHSYVRALRWLDARQVEVQLQGHTDGEWMGNSIRPGQCFDLRYRISREGAVQKVSQKSHAIRTMGCGG